MQCRFVRPPSGRARNAKSHPEGGFLLETSGGASGTRTPDLRIMIPRVPQILWYSEAFQIVAYSLKSKRNEAFGGVGGIPVR
jgi:hypothetical protein